MRGRWINGVALAALFGLGAPALAQDLSADISTTGRIAAGQTAQGTIEQAGDTDWFQITLRGGQGYRFTLNADGEGETALADPYLRLLNADGREIGVNDDSGGTLNSRLDIEAPADGVYYLEAAGFGSSSGAYVLGAIERDLPTDSVPADASTRSSITVGRPLMGSIDFDGDADWHRVTLQTGSIFRITLNSSGDTPLPDPYLRLLNADGQEVAANDDFEGLNSGLDFVPTTTGVYYVEARNLMESGNGTYTINVTRQALPEDAVSSDTRTRGRLAPGGEVRGTLDFPRDTDWYRINLEGGETYRFSLESNGEPALGDPLLRLLNAQGEEVARDDDGGPGLNSALEFIAPARGVYYLEARGFMDDAVGGYVLRARQGDIPGNASTDVSIDAQGDYIEGQLNPAGDRDWYRLELGAGDTVRLRLMNAGMQAVGDPLMAVYDSSGAEIARDDDSGGDLNSYLEFTAPSGGVFFVEARGFSDEAQGSYALQLQAGEIGDSAEGAESINPQGAPALSEINPADDSDWYVLQAVEGRAYRVFLDAVEGGETALDPMLRLYDANSTLISEDDDGGAGVNSYLSFVAPESNALFLAVSSYAGSSAGRYALRVVDTETPGNAATEEMLDSNDDARTNRIDMPGDKDWYAIEVVAGESYRISVDGTGDYPLADPMVAVLAYPYGFPGHDGEEGASQTPLASDDDSGRGRNALLTYRAAETGSLFVQVTGKRGGVGTYTVAIQRVGR